MSAPYKLFIMGEANMKNKIITFLLSMGMPLATIYGSYGCNGSCGSCTFNCTPGLFLLIILAGKVLYKKAKVRIFGNA